MHALTITSHRVYVNGYPARRPLRHRAHSPGIPDAAAQRQTAGTAVPGFMKDACALVPQGDGTCRGMLTDHANLPRQSSAPSAAPVHPAARV